MKGLILVLCGALLIGLAGCTATQKGAGTGALLGGLAGGVIGHNQDGKTAEGAAIGAGAGALLGGLAGKAHGDATEEARREGYEAGRRDAERQQSSGYQSDYRE